MSNLNKNCCNNPSCGCNSTSLSCTAVISCVNKELFKIVEEQSNSLGHLCPAVVKCIDNQFFNITSGNPTDFEYYSSSIFEVLKSLPGYDEDEQLVITAENGDLFWSTGGGGGYTDEQAQDAAAAMIKNGVGISWIYNDAGNSLTPAVTLSPFSTTNLSEGSNLYFTNERVDDRVSQLLIEGNGIDLAYNDAGNQLTISQTEPAILGSLYNKSSWTDLSDFVDSGVDASIISNKIAFASGQSDFSDSLGVDYVTGLERWTIEAEITAGSKNGSSTGFALGIKSVNSTGGAYIQNFIAKFDATSGVDSGKLSIYTNTNTLIKTSTTALTFNIGDVIRFRVDRNINNFSIVVENVTSPAIVRMYHTIAGSQATPNAGRPTIWALGGAFTLNKLNVSSKEVVGATLRVVGDSKGGSYLLSDPLHRYPSRLQKYFTSTTAHSGNADKTIEILQVVPEIIALRPRYVFLSIGHNDVGTGVLLATIQANIQSITSSLEAAGIVVLHGLIYSSVTSQTSLKSWLDSTYPGAIIPTYEAIQASAALALSDGTHLNTYGHELVFESIVNSGKVSADRDLTFKEQGYINGISDYIRRGGNAFGDSFSIGPLDDNDLNISRNGTPIITLQRRGASNVSRIVLNNMGGTSINAAEPVANAATMQVTSYNGGTIFNLALAGSDPLLGAGLRLTTHFEAFGTDDFIMYMLPGEITPRTSGYAMILGTEFAGLRLGTYNTTASNPIFFDINFTNRSFMDPEKWSYDVWLRIKERTFAATTPASGYGNLYPKNDGKIYYQNSAGTEFDLTASGSGGVSDGTYGDITVSGGGSVWTIGNNTVSNAKLRQSAALSLVGNSTNALANVADIVAGTDHQVMRRSGTSIGFGAINLAQSAAVTGTLDETNGGTGLNSFTTGDILYATGANTLGKLAIGTDGHVLTLVSGIPAWQAPSGGGGGSTASTTFNATSDWGSPSAGYYSYSFAHGLSSTDIIVFVWDETGTAVQVLPEIVERTDNNTITIYVADSPDSRFAGRIIVKL